MKKLILIILITMLSSCSTFFDGTFSDDSAVTSNKIYITQNEVFDIKTPHFCYFFLVNCSSCELIKDKIEVYASEHKDFYMIEAPDSYQKGITKDDSVGATKIEDIKFLGFPTLIFVENNSMKRMYVGVSEITNLLF